MNQGFPLDKVAARIVGLGILLALASCHGEDPAPSPSVGEGANPIPEELAATGTASPPSEPVRPAPSEPAAPAAPPILAPVPAGEPIPPDVWITSVPGRPPEVISAMSSLYRAAGMTTLVAGTPYGPGPVDALVEWLGALVEQGLLPEEIGLDRIVTVSRGACGWRLGGLAAQGSGDPLTLWTRMTEGSAWVPPALRFACDGPLPPAPELDLALVGAALTAARRLGRGEAPPASLLLRWAGPERLLEDLQGLLPRSDRYWRKLAALRRIAGPWSRGEFPVLEGRGALKRGQQGPRVEVLRRRLAMEGFLPAEAASGQVFDREVRDAVLAYREAYGLKHRSRVDGEMLTQLSRPPEALLGALRGSMRRSLERGWDRHGTSVLVNIPAFRTALYVDGRRVASYRAVVGFPDKGGGGQTPELDGALSHVEINPTWTPSAYTVSHELEREAREDRGFWRKHHFVRRGARWIQEPGPWNTLGQVLVAWPNSREISIHGTDEARYFDYMDRALSDGSIRVENIEDLAARILALVDQTPAEGLEPLFEGIVERRIELDGAVPIQVIYDRVAVTDQGLIGLRPDIYRMERGRDAEALAAPLEVALADARHAETEE